MVGTTTATCAPVDGGGEGGAQGHFGLAETDVAADQPVHRPALARGPARWSRWRRVGRRFHHRGSGRRIPRRDRPAGSNFGASLQRPRGGDLDQPLRHVADAQFQPRLPFAARRNGRAGRAARLGVLRAVARQKLDVLHRHEQLVAAMIMQLQAIMRRARRLDDSSCPIKRPMP